MRYVFRHGWGFDAAFWDPLRRALDRRDEAVDRGYFGPARDAALPDEPHIVIGHSLGALLMLGETNPSCRAMVAINGFDRFSAAPGFPGVALRVIDRMLQRCEAEPDAVVRDFRSRCGEDSPPPAPATPRLTEDLRLLRDADAHEASPAVPLLALDGGKDPLLSEAHRKACFPGAAQRVVLDEGGHLLPLTHADWCAAQIRAFVAA